MISLGLKLSAIPLTMVLISIPTSTFSFNNFLVLAIFSASKIVPILISNLVKSSKSMVGFWGSKVLLACWFASFVASNLSNCS